MTIQTAITAEQLFEMGDIGRCELVRGEIIMMAPAGAEHGDIALNIAYCIKAHVIAQQLGKVYAAETGFIIARDPDTTRAPDVAFVRQSRVPATPVKGFFPGPPDLAVEVISPLDRMAQLMQKVNDWLSAGVISVWVVDPTRRILTVHRAGGVAVVYQQTDELSDEPTLPGFTVKVRELFG